ncbi:hypothetical protein ABT040_45185, partial [Streptomyces sp. NPDC002688]|uniref:hypothetical protein n=1 Tax=Streptomyces sp. NPDC002688 TaxID=3154423 RepID=UPI00331F1208
MRRRRPPRTGAHVRLRELVHMARRGDRRVTVHLRWTVRGPGSFRGTARLRIAHQRKPPEAE